MAEVTITTEETAPISSGSEVEIVNPDEVIEAIETVSDNEVTIAAIEADKEIKIEEIRAEARVEEAEAYAEAQTAPEDDKWTILEKLASTLETVETRLATLELMQTSLALVEEMEAETIAEEVAEELNDLTPQSMSAPTSETQTEVIEKSEEESLIPPVVEVSGKPIIRLV